MLTREQSLVKLEVKESNLKGVLKRIKANAVTTQHNIVAELKAVEAVRRDLENNLDYQEDGIFISTASARVKWWIV